jgi:hypothetical protein
MSYAVYRITIKGHLDPEWSEWFDGLTITLVGNGETILTGQLIDQTSLHGVLIKIRDLGLPLLSLTRIETGREHESNPFVPLLRSTSRLINLQQGAAIRISEAWFLGATRNAV